MVMPAPQRIERNPTLGLRISWSNGAVSNVSAKTLREQCPCAGCREARGDLSHQAPLGGKKSMLRVVESTLSQEIELVKVWPIGNYAVGIEWGDGHSTGIYTYSYLHQLCAPLPAAE